MTASALRAIMASMVEEPIAFLRAERRSQPVRTGRSGGQVAQVSFDRAELRRILTLYGKMVALGEWRDYAVDFLGEAAAFSIFRRASEAALFTIEKRPELRLRQGQYAVLGASGLVLKRGHDLAQVLRIFDRKLLRAMAAQPG